MVECPACHKNYTPSGFSNHIGQTQKPACAALKGQFLPTIPDHCSLSPAPQNSANEGTAAPPSLPDFANFDMDVDPIPFEGDFFGNYDPEFFDDRIVQELPESPSDSDSDVSHDLAPASWEPEVSAVGEPGFQADDGLAGGPSIPSAPEHNVIEQTAKRRTHVIHFPSTGAGAPLLAGSVPEAAAMTSMHSAYGVSVDVAQTGNPYALFASRLDWEIARWAKLRGSGSMAFTELLQIEEVCHCIYLSHHLCRSA